MDSVEDVVIDEGIFKYILIEIKDNGRSKLIVRGFKECNFHDDIMNEVEEELKSKGLTLKCLGGGKLEHCSVEKKIVVYGYSVGYGKADHDLTVNILKTRFPNYDINAIHDNVY